MDADSGLVHTLETTAANVHDSNKVVDLLQETEEEVYGDSGYLGAEKKEDAILVNDKRASFVTVPGLASILISACGFIR